MEPTLPNNQIKPLALDLCCGKGGWSIGLLKAGWDVIGVDIEDMGGYPSHLVFADVREIAKDVQAYFPALKFDLVVASPPCQEFSISSQPFKRSRERFNKERPPSREIWDASVKIAKDLGAPLILENVRGAVPFMGSETWNYGSYYFWGQMPALQPIPYMRSNGVMSHRKGFQASAKTTFGKDKDDAIHQISKSRNGLQRTKSIFVGECDRIDGVRGGLSRKEWAARIAMIPEELSTWIGTCFYPKEYKK